jgi:hypothetical protein
VKDLVAEMSELVGKTLEAESMDKVTDWEEAVTINKAGVLFGFHTPQTRGFVSKIATNFTSEIDGIATSMDAYTKSDGTPQEAASRTTSEYSYGRDSGNGSLNPPVLSTQQMI